MSGFEHRFKPSERKGFEAHASIQAIQSYQVAYGEHIAALTREASWLARLGRDRLRQIERGEWPPPKPNATDLVGGEAQ